MQKERAPFTVSSPWAAAPGIPQREPAGEDGWSWGKPTCVSSQVYYLGEGEDSRQWLQQEPNTRAELCLSYMEAVASHVQARHPTTTPLVWDDMLRDIPEDQLSGRPGMALGGRPRSAGGFLVP